jgi:hypothetical protein
MAPSPIRSPLVLWANSTLNRLHEDWQSTGNVDEVRLTQGDTVGIELHWLKTVSQIGLVHDEVIFPSNANITLAIGRIDAAPEAGVFAFGYGGQHTADIDFDATPAEVQAALNALSSISAEGGVTVSKTSTTYKIVWNDPGVLASSLTTYSNDLLPNSTIGIGLARAGTSTIAAIYNVHIKQAPVAACTTWENADGTDLTIAIESTVINGFQKMRTWVLEFSNLPRGGSFTISWVSGTGSTGTSLEIDIESMTPSGVSLAFQQSGSWGQTWFISTSKRTPLTYAISVWVSTNIPTAVLPITSMAVTNDNVTDFSTKTGLLSINTVEVESLLAGQGSAEATMEIEVEIDGSRQTILQTSVLIVNDLIDTDVYDLVEWGSVIPADSVVRYDTSQSLSAGQKAQARSNIGAIDATALDVLIAKDTELELLIGGQNLTTDELDAIKGAATPSETNLFLTKSATDALYAALTHQHLPADIIGLQTTLDGFSSSIGTVQAAVTGLQTSKAESYHVQPTSTITGLDTILADFDTRIAGFAQFNHTHDIDDITDLESRLAPLELFQTNSEPNVPTTAQKAALDNAEVPTALNPLVTESRLNALLTGSITGFSTELYVDTAVSDATNLLPTQYLNLQGDSPTTAPAGNLTTTHYDLELTVVQNGVAYIVPAKLA